MHRQTLTIIVFMLLSLATLAEPVHLTFEIQGRAPLHVVPVDSPGYGLLGVSVFTDEPVVATVAAINVPPGAAMDWIQGWEWTVTTESGDPVPVRVQRADDAPILAQGHLRLRKDVSFVNLRFVDLGVGRYIVNLSWKDPESGKRRTADSRFLAIYRGDETPRIRRFDLRRQAGALLAKGTADAYREARPLLLEAAADNDDPSVYEELADASAPWAPPEETADYYRRSLDLARENLQRNHGPQKDWPAEAQRLYVPRARKVEAFRTLLPYYRANFNQLRVVVSRENGTDKFVVERRADGARIRVIDPQQR